jgi:hypothetical protein
LSDPIGASVPNDYLQRWPVKRVNSSKADADGATLISDRWSGRF